MRRLLALLFPPRHASASVARERLKIVLAHERANRDQPDFLPTLQRELIEVVGRYLEIKPDMIRVNLDKSGETSLLEINVEIDRAKVKTTQPSATTKPATTKPATTKPAGTAKPAAAAAKPPVASEPRSPGAKPAVIGGFDAGEAAPWVKPG